jgi:hypothetical protein
MIFEDNIAGRWGVDDVASEPEAILRARETAGLEPEYRRRPALPSPR